MQDKDNVQYMYVRDVANRPVIMVAYVIDQTRTAEGRTPTLAGLGTLVHMRYGWSIWRTEDQYDRTLGRNIALGRLMSTTKSGENPAHRTCEYEGEPRDWNKLRIAVLRMLSSDVPRKYKHDIYHTIRKLEMRIAANRTKAKKTA